MFEPLIVGGKVEVYKKSNRIESETEHREPFLSQVIDISEAEEHVLCTMPVEKGRLVVLEVGMTIETYFYTPKGIYRADCVIQARGKEGNIFTMQLGLLSKLQKHQRREYFRLDCNITTKITALTDDEIDEYNRTERIPDNLLTPPEEGIAIDISGGGLRVFSKKMMQKNSIVVVEFEIPIGDEVKKMRLMARVVLGLKNVNDNSIYDSRLQFMKVSKDDTEQIVKYIFVQQRLMRQKERGL